MARKRKGQQRFHERFGLDVGQNEARQQFTNRSRNYMENVFFPKLKETKTDERREVLWRVANVLGMKWAVFNDWAHYTGEDFHKHLAALEVVYAVVPSDLKTRLAALVSVMLEESPIDLGVEFRSGSFVRKGAGILDERLVSDPLDWLSNREYSAVYQPFSSALSAFVKEPSNPQVLARVVTEAYEALEAMAKIVTERPRKDLSANAELFLSRLSVGDQYKAVLRELIKYANLYRHASDPTQPKPVLSEREVESYIYLVGLLLRLAVSSVQAAKRQFPAQS